MLRKLNKKFVKESLLLLKENIKKFEVFKSFDKILELWINILNYFRENFKNEWFDKE